MLKRSGDCAAACEESLALEPSNAKVRARWASALLARGDFAAARATAVGADAALANAARQVEATEAALLEADEALAKGEPAKAQGFKWGVGTGWSGRR